MTVEEICRNAQKQGIEIGALFSVQGADPALSQEIITKELVFNRTHDKTWYFDTLILQSTLFGMPLGVQESICERRYMVQEGYTISLWGFKKGAQHYHDLLEEIKI